MILAASALLGSAAIIWFATGESLAVIAYLAGIFVLSLVAKTLLRTRSPATEQDAALPDWTVTSIAIEQEGAAVAITDRANRLVCANSAWEGFFGAENAPPALPLDEPGSAALLAAARTAWRDGSMRLPLVAGEQAAWRVEVTRAGRAEDYLVWRFVRIEEADPAADIAARITGRLGEALSRAGIEAAVVDQEGVIRVASAGFARRAVGDPAATLAGHDFASLLRTDDQDRIFFAREARRGQPQMLVHVGLGTGNSGAQPSIDEAPALILLVDASIPLGVGSEPATQAGTPQLEGLLAKLPLGLAMADRDGHFLFANAAFLRAAGLEEGKLPPYPSDLVVKEDKGALADAVRRFGQGKASSGDMAVRLRGNPEDPVSLGIAGVRGLGEASVLLSLADTTEETRLKRQVAQATKMQAVGQLAGGVAHDFNNVLTAIIGYCDLMLLRHTPGDSDYDDIQQIRANSNRAASLTRQLLAFSRQQTLRPQVLQLPDVVSEVSQLLKRLMGEKIEFKVSHVRDLGAVRADPQQLEQVIVNLAVNARDAMQSRGDGSGTLMLSTRAVPAEQVRRMKSEIIPIADYTALVVEDTGGGIPTEHIGKIFEPFFTTKETGKGTGLGLSTVYGIVKQSGGFIFADNVPGPDGRIKGARFTVYLPVHRGEAPAKQAAKPAPARKWSGGGRILLVEDEDMVRAVAERALAREGYSIVTASDGEEGLDIVRKGERFDLVLSDVVMPSLDGPAMAREIRVLAPEVPVLFMSGYAEEQLRREIDIDHVHFIAKPFSVQQIATKVAEVLTAG
jgi:two-component system cell cycle sensor histidine kinase/response regulator CckA